MDSVLGVYAGFSVLILHSDKHAHIQLPLSTRADVLIDECLFPKLTKSCSHAKSNDFFFSSIILFELDDKKKVFEKVN